MGRKPSVQDYVTLLRPDIDHDIYVIGSQESVETIVGSMFAPSKQLIIDNCSTALGPEFAMVHSISL
jgi:hypothetical protein